MPGQPFIQVDAFTQRPFAGNPAAVCLLPGQREEGWMQLVAREMNLAETAFLVPEPDGYQLRWFTPVCEVDLCGHATLASAHALWESGELPPGATARFHSRSGLLTAVRSEGRTWLDFPVTPPTPTLPPPDLARALGAPVISVWRTPFDLLVELPSEVVVRGLVPDLTALAAFPARGVIVTAASSDPSRDFVSRFFAPRSGVPEDPVTGSAHCALGPFWGRRLGRTELVAEQVSSRGGTIWVRLAGDRTHLGGHAVTVLRGELFF